MIIARGKKNEQIEAAHLRKMIAPYGGVTLDVGTGDGRWAYRYAEQHPERFVIGMDPVAENMREMSAKAARKPGRGGLANVLYVIASIEQPPEELRGIADEIFVTLPWGSLMRGIILGDDAVLEVLASFGAPHPVASRRPPSPRSGDGSGAALRIVLNTRIFDDPVPIEVGSLPDVTPEYVRDALGKKYASHGIEIADTRWLDADEVAAIGTTWAKRLSHRAPPRSVLIEARAPHNDGNVAR